jgi:ATP cone domain
VIRAHDNIAWVKFDDGHLAPFDERRLALSIQSVAERLGDSDWWLAESIAAAVHAFAVKCHSNSIIASKEIADVVVSVLSMLGFKELAQAYTNQRRRAAIHLGDLAGRVGTAFELEFFRQLDHALVAAADQRLSLLEVDGLRTCVMQLCGARRWTAGCRRFAEDIVEYVRERVVRVRPSQAVCLQLAVVE